MALLDDIRTLVRVSPIPMPDASGLQPEDEGWEPTYSSDFDVEIQLLIDAAFADLTRVGIVPSLLDAENPAPLVKQAVALYAKAHFGYDNSERPQFVEAYNRTVIDLLNSSANIACWRTSMRDCVIADIPDQAYTGHTVRPVPEVTFDGESLEANGDFLVRYADNVEVGTATCYIEGTGSYGGVARATFRIVGE